MTTGTIAENCNKTDTFLSTGNTSDKEVWHPKHKELLVIQEYLEEKAKNLPVKLDFDITAKENLYFDTLNYTTYAGFLIVHPVCFEQALRQMSDAYADRLKPVGFIDHIKSTINNDGSYSKYIFVDNEKVKPYKAVVVLPGGNKLKKHCCVGKIKKILEKHGKSNVVFKKHPISYDEIYTELSEYLGGINYAPAHSDLFELMNNSEYVYSTMLSESALIANVLGKKVEHFDLLQNRDLGSFTHINYYLYSTENPVEWADITFSSYKSGVFHPVIDADWKKKVDNYLAYIMKLRSFYKDAYVLK